MEGNEYEERSVWTCLLKESKKNGCSRMTFQMWREGKPILNITQGETVVNNGEEYSWQSYCFANKQGAWDMWVGVKNIVVNLLFGHAK